jgi:hypothetical protein
VRTAPATTSTDTGAHSDKCIFFIGATPGPAIPERPELMFNCIGAQRLLLKEQMNDREQERSPQSHFIVKLKISPKHYQGPFDNMLQKLESEKHGKSEMKGTIIYKRNWGPI